MPKGVSTKPKKSSEITPEMRQEFWNHNLNSHTGLPAAKDLIREQSTIEIHSLNDFGARINSTDGYGNK